MKFEFEKEFRAAHPETIGETDREFDSYNYMLWLEQQLKNCNLQNVSQQRELFNAILDFTEDLPLVSEDYNRNELWEQFRALNCG